MDISERIARIIGFQQIQLAEKDAMIEQLQASLQEKTRELEVILTQARDPAEK